MLHGHIDNMIGFRNFNLRPGTQQGDIVNKGLTIVRQDQSQVTVEMYVFLGVNLRPGFQTSACYTSDGLRSS